VPVGGIAEDFTLQAGVPMIDVKDADGAITLSQDRFGTDPASRAARSWRVPVLTAVAADDARRLIVTAQQPVTLPAAPALLVNPGHTGYFVTRYAPGLLRRLLDRLPTLSAQDQLGLFGDTSALASAGYTPMASLLELAAALPADADPTVWTALCNDLTELGRHYDEGAPARAYERWVRDQLTRVFARVGWEPQTGESVNTMTLRATLVTALAEAGDEGVNAEARRRFDRFVMAPDTLQGDLRNAVLGAVMLNADAAAWERLRAIARTLKSTLEQDQVYEVLGASRDPALARRALELAISGEPPRTVVPTLVQAVAVRHAAATFEFVASHWSRIAPLVVPSLLNVFAPRIAAGSDDPDTAAHLAEFSKQVAPACDPGQVRKAIASIRYLASIKQQRLAEVDRWLAART